MENKTEYLVARKSLSYNSDTGIFTRTKYSPRIAKKKIGKPTGYITTLGYMDVRIQQKTYKLHRLAFLFMGEDMPKEVDHIDGDKTNNKWSNLRAATRSENCRNRCMSSNNTSGHSCVYINKGRGKKYFSKVGGKHLGSFDHIYQAVRRRNEEFKKNNYSIRHGA